MARPWTASQFAYQGVTFGTRIFFSLWTPRLVLALHAEADHLWGDVPFWEWNQLGGISSVEGLGGLDTVRGVPRNRYGGNTKALGNVELRWATVEIPWGPAPLQIGLSGFYDTGRVWQPGQANGKFFDCEPVAQRRGGRAAPDAPGGGHPRGLRLQSRHQANRHLRRLRSALLSRRARRGARVASSSRPARPARGTAAPPRSPGGRGRPGARPSRPRRARTARSRRPHPRRCTFPVLPAVRARARMRAVPGVPTPGSDSRSCSSSWQASSTRPKREPRRPSSSSRPSSSLDSTNRCRAALSSTASTFRSSRRGGALAAEGVARRERRRPEAHHVRRSAATSPSESEAAAVTRSRGQRR